MNESRRLLGTGMMVRVAMVIAVAFVSSLQVAAGRADDRPNILFVYTDDQAPWGFGGSGYAQAHTPNMDRLASEGACLRNSFVTTPVCSPARASLMTSRYASEYAILDFIPHPGHKLYDPTNMVGLNPDSITFAEILHAGGYATGLVGKWHLGDWTASGEKTYHPTNHGFDYFMGLTGGGIRPDDPPLEKDGSVRTFEGLTTDILTDNALDFIRARCEEPFLLCLHYRAPHAKWLPVADEDWAPYENLDPVIPNPDYPDLDVQRVKRMTREYLASITGVDRNLGRVLEALNELNIARDTVVIFTSDHGYNMGHNGIFHKGNGIWVTKSLPKPTPNIAAKYRPNMYDNSLKVPAIVKWPGVVRPGSVIGQTTTSLDWYPTIVDIAGAELSPEHPVRGRSLVPLLKGEAPPDWDQDYYGEYSMINYCRALMRCYRTPEWKLVRDFLNPERDELYDLKNDPAETRNLIRDSDPRIAEVIERLDAKLRRRMEENGDELLKEIDALIELEPGHKQLFLDDHALQSMKGLRRTMHRPKKRGAVFRPEGAGDGIRVQTASAPVWIADEKVYKLFYMAFPYEKGNWVVDEIGCALAVSKDGIHWERPVLGQVALGGSKKNNRFFVIDPSARWTSNSMVDVIYDVDSLDSEQRYKGLLGAQNRVPVVSSDGIRWSKVASAKIPSSDTSTLVYDEIGKQYIATVKHGTKYGRSAFVTFSKDFEQWTAPRPSFHTDDQDQELAKERIRRRLADPGMQDPLFNDPDPDTGWKPPEGQRQIPTWRAETYRLTVFPYEGVYVGLPMIYYPTGQALPARNNTVGFHDIQLIFSRDPELRPENWVRLGNREPFIETSRLDEGLVGNYDRQQIAPLNRPLVMGDELWFYYIGAKGRTPPYKMWPDGRVRNQQDLTPEEQADFDDGWIAVCLATLRLDGFVSLDAGNADGELITKPLVATGKELVLNVDVHSGGAVGVEVLGGDGAPLRGFELANCVELRGQGVCQPMTWRSGSTWRQVYGRTVRLRIRFRMASLYAFWTE